MNNLDDSIETNEEGRITLAVTILGATMLLGAYLLTPERDSIKEIYSGAKKIAEYGLFNTAPDSLYQKE